MKSPTDPNLALLERVATRLEPLLDNLVLVGGCAVGILITDRAAPPIRATLDVDMIVDAATYSDYHHFGEMMRPLGFLPSGEPGDPICRFVCGEMKVDIIPALENILGFGNRWYVAAIEKACKLVLPGGLVIKHVSAPYFLATKLIAFRTRGQGDFLGSPDLEDLISVVDGREELVGEVRGETEALREFISDQIADLLSDRGFRDCLSGHLPRGPETQERLDILLERLKSLV